MPKKRTTSIELKIYCYLKEQQRTCSRKSIAEYLNIAPTTVGAALKRIEEEQAAGCLPEGMIQRVKGGFRVKKMGDEFSDEEVQLLSDIVCTSEFLSNDQAEALAQKIRDVLQDSRAKQQLCVERLAVRAEKDVKKMHEISYAVYRKKYADFYYKGERYKTIPLKFVMVRGRYFLIAALFSKGKKPKVGANIDLLAFDIDNIVLSTSSIFGFSTEWRELADNNIEVQAKVTALIETLQ